MESSHGNRYRSFQSVLILLALGSEIKHLVSRRVSFPCEDKEIELAVADLCANIKAVLKQQSLVSAILATLYQGRRLHLRQAHPEQRALVFLSRVVMAWHTDQFWGEAILRNLCGLGETTDRGFKGKSKMSFRAKARTWSRLQK
jgi:hypothetical protein